MPKHPSQGSPAVWGAPSIFGVRRPQHLIKPLSASPSGSHWLFSNHFVEPAWLTDRTQEARQSMEDAAEALERAMRTYEQAYQGLETATAPKAEAETAESDVPQFIDEDFDSLEEMQAMDARMSSALREAFVILEDAKLFLESRGKHSS